LSKRRWILFSLAAVFALAVIAVALVPSLREKTQSLFGRPTQEVLATAEGDVLNDGSNAKVVKIRGADGIFVEVFRLGPGGESTLVDRILLPDKHDGLFNFHGHVTRLAISDINGDGKNELLAPTFDNQLVPHLNVFRYNPAIGRFELYQPPK
jgi:hypothetical protein